MRSCIIRRLSAVFMLYLAVFLLCAPNVFAAEKALSPTIDQAVISIEPKGEGINLVTERITLENANLAKDKKVEHLIITFPGATAKELQVSSDQKSLPFNEVEGDGVRRLFVSVPEGTNTLAYMIQYTVQTSKEENRIPLVVPFYSTNGIKNAAIQLRFALPKGMYLHSSMPNYLGPANVPIKETLTAIPSFVIFNYGPAPQAVSANTWIGLINVLGILIVIVFWLLYERRKGGILNV